MYFDYKNNFNENQMKNLLPGTLVQVVAEGDSSTHVKEVLNGKYGMVLKRVFYPDSKYSLLVLIADKKYIVHCRDLEVVSE